MNEVRIEGWTCYVSGDSLRCARHGNGGFELQLDKDGGLGGDCCYVPTAVLAWLVAPLLHAAWDACAGVLMPSQRDDLRAHNPYLPAPPATGEKDAK